jgi:hypothetical protein
MFAAFAAHGENVKQCLLRVKRCGIKNKIIFNHQKLDK